MDPTIRAIMTLLMMGAKVDALSPQIRCADRLVFSLICMATETVYGDLGRTCFACCCCL